ncbi:hypothetical protein QLL95_gp1045 [Cotonvirus japonicus]|uniref:Thioredoxin-like fold n=1 Tax=Cotonvirus japonicus TaxID=2811091 RepID=A0ABM7NSD8_9VIRU|nr:hypothetical protein QLL95_gp1045 [Cotonvirus japonicus]BCS83078.1 hypothetical protein [Cotonvirus japonicus]
MSKYNLLFYSNHCEASQQLLAMFATENLTRFFYLICTDNNPKIPPQIKITPTFIIKGNPVLYEGANAFAWLNKIKQYKILMSMQKIGSAQQQYLKNIGGPTMDSNILGFSQAEMSGMSDIFSFFSKNMDHECQDAMPQTFVQYNNLGNDNIFTPPLENGKYKVSENNSNKINAQQQKSLEKNILSERKKQDELFKQSIDNFSKQYSK